MPGRAEGGSSARYGGEHERGPGLDIIDSEAKDTNAFASEPIGAPLVAFLLVVVGWAVNFNSQLRGGTIEVEYVRTNGVLAAEVEAKFVASKQGPECTLGLGQRTAHFFRTIADEIR